MVGAELVFARHKKTTNFYIICGQRQDYDPTIDTISGGDIYSLSITPNVGWTENKAMGAYQYCKIRRWKHVKYVK